MERSAYELLKNMERSWWYQGRREAVLAALEAASVPRAEQMLDFGAGFGGMSELAQTVAEQADAYEPDALATDTLISRGYRNVYRSEREALAAPHELIGLFDVLEHIEDDSGFLTRAYEALPDNGRMVVTVPAYQALWSAHDVTHQHHRRYTKPELVRRFQEAGYVVDYASYWNMSLLPVAAAMRLIGKSGGEGLVPPAPINKALTALLTLESFLLRHIPLPFGLSIVLVARKGDVRAQPRRVRAAAGFLARYGISGLAGGITQASVLYIWVSILKFTNEYLLGLALGFIAALAIAFLLQKFWTFRNRVQGRTTRQLISYTCVAFFGLALNAVLLAGAKSLCEALDISFFAGWYLFFQFIAFCIVSTSNLALNALITFRNR